MKTYIVQINMADGIGVDWQNSDIAFKTREEAEADIAFMMKEYGILEQDLRIVELTVCV